MQKHWYSRSFWYPLKQRFSAQKQKLFTNTKNTGFYHAKGKNREVRKQFKKTRPSWGFCPFRIVETRDTPETSFPCFCCYMRDVKTFSDSDFSTFWRDSQGNTFATSARALSCRSLDHLISCVSCHPTDGQDMLLRIFSGNKRSNPKRSYFVWSVLSLPRIFEPLCTTFPHAFASLWFLLLFSKGRNCWGSAEDMPLF